jgi:hypothetical protein
LSFTGFRLFGIRRRFAAAGYPNSNAGRKQDGAYRRRHSSQTARKHDPPIGIDAG